MITILSHIGHVIEAPFLPVFEFSNIGEVPTAGQLYVDITEFDPEVGITLVELSSADPDYRHISEVIHMTKGEKLILQKNTGITHGIAKLIDSTIPKADDTIEFVKFDEGGAELFYECESNDEYIVFVSTQDYSKEKYDYYKENIYRAHLEGRNNGEKSDVVACEYMLKNDKDGRTNDNALMYFHFTPHQLRKFEDREKLSLYIYNENYEQAWYNEKAYRFKKTKITCDNESANS